MAHSCPECGQVCYCGTDIDDCIFDREEDVVNCVHCLGKEEDEEGWEDCGDLDEPLCDNAGCTCATFDPSVGRYQCAVSGSECMFLVPDSKRCAEKYGEGPDAQREEVHP
jgi:hypothetical protein